MPITNCHVHTFTHDHTPNRFLPWPVPQLARFALVRMAVIGLARTFDRDRKGALGRYAEIIKTSYNRSQRDVFAIVQSFYPDDARFVVLPMDMTQMNAGAVAAGIADQHEELASLAAAFPKTVVPFAAVDPRHPQIVETTIALIKKHDFRGLKLYPPTGHHPFDRRLWDLYAYAEENGLPVMTHCSRPASVQYRGEPTEDMRQDPVTGTRLDLPRFELLTYFTDPDAYVPLLKKFPRLRVCLAHFGGAGDWRRFIEKPAQASDPPAAQSWLTKILAMIRSGNYPNLWTDIAYTLFAHDDYVYLLKDLLADETTASRVLFGSDFYVVENAELEERSRSIRIRALLGEELFTQIAETNPKLYLDGPSITPTTSASTAPTPASNQP
jgi:predicted TIM-barrel fold metal-dependent hydrolase